MRRGAGLSDHDLAASRQDAARAAAHRDRAQLLANMMFVVVSRTALVTMPIMLAVFALLHLKWRTSLMMFGAAVVSRRTGLGGIAALQWTTTTFLAGLSDLQGTESADVDRDAAGVLAEIAAVHRRGAGHRARHRIDARAVRAGRDRPQGARRRPGRQQSAQSDPARRDPVGRARRDRALRDLVAASVAVSRRGPGGVDRPDGGGAEYLHLAVQFTPVRFSPGLDVRAGRRRRRRHGAWHGAQCSETAASHPS